MIRAHLFSKQNRADPMFRWRGGEVSRIEGLSDAVFALALTLLVIRTDVPRTFLELTAVAEQLPVFLACFAMLMMAWRYHFLFFRRYGLQDLATTVLNAGYLFLVLFCVFPLKFMATFLYRMVTGQGTRTMFDVPAGTEWLPRDEQGVLMMVFYGLAIFGVFGLQAAMVMWAWRQRDALELDELERFLTRSSIVAHGVTCGIALLSVLIAVVLGNPGLAGLAYFLMPVLHPIHGFRTAKQSQALLARRTPVPTAEPVAS